MTDMEQVNIIDKVKDVGSRIMAINATQEEKDYINIVLNQIITDLQKLEVNPTNFH